MEEMGSDHHYMCTFARAEHGRSKGLVVVRTWPSLIEFSKAECELDRLKRLVVARA